MTNNIDFDLVLVELGFFADPNGAQITIDVVTNSVLAALVTLFCCPLICCVCIIAQESRRHQLNHRESVSSGI